MSPINELLIYCGIGFLMIIVSFVFLRIRRDTQDQKYEMNYHKLQLALERRDVQNINQYGTILLWNDNMEKAVYFELKKMVEELLPNNPSLAKLKKEIDLLFEKQMWLID
jgi:hypothetical protein